MSSSAYALHGNKKLLKWQKYEHLSNSSLSKKNDLCQCRKNTLIPNKVLIWVFPWDVFFGPQAPVLLSCSWKGCDPTPAGWEPRARVSALSGGTKRGGGREGSSGGKQHQPGDSKLDTGEEMSPLMTDPEAPLLRCLFPWLSLWF